MKELNLNLGVEEYLLAGKVAVSFNPTDMNFLERLSRAFSELDALQEEVRATREKITDDREVFPIARELDGKMRGILNDLFGKEICEPLFGSMNLFASSGGLPVWANLMLAITDEVQSALQGGQPETHIPRWPESPSGEGTAPPLEPQPQAPSLPIKLVIIKVFPIEVGAEKL